jgi:hypothetical protein
MPHSLEYLIAKREEVHGELIEVQTKMNRIGYIPMMCSQGEGLLWSREDHTDARYKQLDQRKKSLKRLYDFYTKQLGRLVEKRYKAITR